MLSYTTRSERVCPPARSADDCGFRLSRFFALITRPGKFTFSIWMKAFSFATKFTLYRSFHAFY